jgi:hypothetical protein
MSNQLRVYTKVLKTLKRMMPGQTQGHVVTLAMMITGIAMGRRAQLAPMSTQVSYPTKDKSIEKRIRRWVKNERVEIEAYFLPYAQALLAGLADNTLLLAMDGSTVGRGCMVLMVGVVFHKRALPIAWVVYRGKKGHASAQTHISVLKLVQALIPKGADVILLGDGEYASVDMLTWIEHHTDWGIVARTASDTRVYSDGEWVSLAALGIQPDGLISLPEALFTRQAFGPIHVIAWWDQAYDHPLYLVTNLELAQEACYWYRRRYRVETLFSDKKSRGFQIDKSHLSDPARLARLFIATGLAYIWMICLGLQAIQQHQTHLIDRADRNDKSMFRLGLDWLSYLLKWGKPFTVQFCVPLCLPFVNSESVR